MKNIIVFTDFDRLSFETRCLLIKEQNFTLEMLVRNSHKNIAGQS